MIENLKFAIVILLFIVAGNFANAKVSSRKVVLIAGKKSHDPGDHEYLKSVRLLKVMLDNAPNLKGFTTETHFNGWPLNPSTLDDANVIVLLSDGSDWWEGNHPFFVDDRMKVIEKQMKRGCGLILFHYSTFAPNKYASQFQEWDGGYFDYESGKPGTTGREAWYSDIKTQKATVIPATPALPISQGLQPFEYTEEFYFKIHFKENDPRLKPILKVAIDGVPEVQTIAWAVEREDGGRGFGFTGGHYYKNWEISNFRKLMLNAIVWAAGGKVPKGGVESKFYSDDEVAGILYGKPIKGLILTGYHSPHHQWAQTTTVLKSALEFDPRVKIDVSENIEDLAGKNLSDYNFLVLNYNNWDKKGLSEAAKKNLVSYLSNGGGLNIIHFANGAFHFSLPAGATEDWPEYRNICRRVWDQNASSAHDQRGEFQVEITNTTHEVTTGIKSFKITDELYCNQFGKLPIEPLLTAKSVVTGNMEPMAWVNNYGKGRIFQTVLGHDVAALSTPELKQLILQGALWSSNNQYIER